MVFFGSIFDWNDELITFWLWSLGYPVKFVAFYYDTKCFRKKILSLIWKYIWKFEKTVSHEAYTKNQKVTRLSKCFLLIFIVSIQSSIEFLMIWQRFSQTLHTFELNRMRSTSGLNYIEFLYNTLAAGVD